MNLTIIQFYFLINNQMNIYISNLSYGTSEASLNDLFAEYGEVTSAKIITDRETGRSRGFGFVEMTDDAQAQTAIEELNGTEFEGKEISVSEARPRTERPSGGFNRGGGGGYNRGGGGGGYRGGNDRGGDRGGYGSRRY